MPKDTRDRYLVLIGNTYFFQKALEPALQNIMKKKLYKKTLQTSDLREARKRRDVMLAKLESKLERMKSDRRPSAIFRKALRELDAIHPQEVEAALDQQIDRLSLQYPNWYAQQSGHPEAPEGQVKEPPQEEVVKLEALAYLHSGETRELPPEFKLSFRDAVGDYIQAMQGEKAGKTLSRTKNALDAFLGYVRLADFPFEAIQRKDVHRWVLSMKAEGKAVSTINNLLSCLSSVWVYHKKIEGLDSSGNPFKDHDTGSRSKDGMTMQPFEPEDLVKMVNGMKDLDDRFPALLSYYTGMRLGEVFNMKPEHIKEEAGIRYVHVMPEGNGKTKNATRRVPVHSALEPWLDRWMTRVATGNTSRNYAGYQKFFSRVKEDAGYQGREYGFHSIRKNTATALRQADVLEQDATWILGHERGATMSYGVYDQKGPTIKKLKELIERIPSLTFEGV